MPKYRKVENNLNLELSFRNILVLGRVSLTKIEANTTASLAVTETRPRDQETLIQPPYLTRGRQRSPPTSAKTQVAITSVSIYSSIYLFINMAIKNINIQSPPKPRKRQYHETNSEYQATARGPRSGGGAIPSSHDGMPSRRSASRTTAEGSV